MKIKVLKKGTSKGKPNSFCTWIMDDWKSSPTPSPENSRRIRFR